MDLLFPISARISSATWTLVSNSAAARSVFTGAVRTLDRTGDRWRVAVTTENANNDREDYPVRAALKALRANARGQTNRIWFCDTSYRPRGSFPVTEIFSNNDFSNGSTGWTATGSSIFTVADRVGYLRAGSSAGNPSLSQLAALTQYAPHVLRSFIADGQETVGTLLGRFLTDGINPVSDYATSRGLGSLALISSAGASQIQYPLVFGATSGFTASAVAIIPWCSLARCALVDNGSNLLLRSDEIDNATWTKSATTTSANSTTAPDGTTTADSLIENTANTTHSIRQSITVGSSAADYCLSVSLKGSSRTWALVQIAEATGNTVVNVWINLSSGAIGTTQISGNWANLRAYVANVGNSWYKLSVIARKTNAATSISANIYTAPSDGVASYLGTSSGIFVWRVGLAQSSSPLRSAQTTSASTSGSSQTGSNLYIKGLPSSTNGLLLQGDRVQVGMQLNEVVAPLNSDSSGLGYLQCAIPWRTSPADNDPVIINQPMGRFILTSPEGGWDDRPGIFSTFSFEMEEALDQ